MLNVIHSVKSVDKLSKVINDLSHLINNLSHLTNDLFTNCQKSDDGLISNQYYLSIFEKINTIGQLLAKL